MAVTTNRYTDEQMARMYSACNVTLGIGNGEGYGYPIFESLACGVPCIHGTYSGRIRTHSQRDACRSYRLLLRSGVLLEACRI